MNLSPHNRIIYLLPAFGTNSKLFSEFHLEGFDLKILEWIQPLQDENISSYASRLIDIYQMKENNYLLGVSFGGMVAVEIDKLITTQKTILISSIKNKYEKPNLFSFLKFGNNYKIISPKLMKKGLFITRPFFGKNKLGYEQFKSTFLEQDDVFLQWGLQQAVLWENERMPKNFIHIHGDKDPLFPITRIRDKIIIKGGNHNMMKERRVEIHSILSLLL